jgi:hypothetical protein
MRLLIHYIGLPRYTLCEEHRGIFWGNGATRKSVLRHNNQRDSSNLPGRSYHGKEMEAGGQVPAENGPNFDTGRPGRIRSRLEGLEHLQKQSRVAGRMGNHLGRRDLLATSPAATLGLRVGVETLARSSCRSRFDTRAAAPGDLARLDLRDAGVTTSRNIKIGVRP